MLIVVKAVCQIVGGLLKSHVAESAGVSTSKTVTEE